jgi:hypothetical protein
VRVAGWSSRVVVRLAAQRFIQLYDAFGDDVPDADLAAFRTAYRASSLAARDEFLLQIACHVAQSPGSGCDDFERGVHLLTRWFLRGLGD